MRGNVKMKPLTVYNLMHKKDCAYISAFPNRIRSKMALVCGCRCYGGLAILEVLPYSSVTHFWTPVSGARLSPVGLVSAIPKLLHTDGSSALLCFGAEGFA
jgi:hypothetical protein